MNNYIQTPSQTVGPYFAYGLTPEQYMFDFRSLANPQLLDPKQNTKDLIILRGRVFDLHRQPLDDAMLEIWQVDTEGVFKTKSLNGFTSFGRMGTGTLEGNYYEFTTCIPAPEQSGYAPAINMIVFMRGLLSHVYTRVYFEEFRKANLQDPYFSLIPHGRQSTLIAKKIQDSPVKIYEFDLHMQGEQETVFFDF